VCLYRRIPTPYYAVLMVYAMRPISVEKAYSATPPSSVEMVFSSDNAARSPVRKHFNVPTSDLWGFVEEEVEEKVMLRSLIRLIIYSWTLITKVFCQWTQGKQSTDRDSAVDAVCRG
jgi:hypothetical protein